MYIFLIIVHVIVCFVLISVVLLQAGRGGGFSEMMGGAQPQNIFGTQTNDFMVRATEVCAVLFIVTSLSLGILSTQRGKSLMERRAMMNSFKKTAATLPFQEKTSAPTVPAATSAPVTKDVVPVVPAPAKSEAPKEAAAPAKA